MDDVADLGDDPAAQRAGLARWRTDVARCFEPGPAPEHPIALQLRDAVAAYPIPRAALEAIIDGCEMDLQRVRYERAEDLYPYCYRVASAVGLCCIEIFGYTDRRARDYAVQLGIRAAAHEHHPRRGQRRQGRAGVSAAARSARVRRHRGRPRGRPLRRALRAPDGASGRARPEFYAAAHAAFPAVDTRSLVPAEIMGRIYRALLEEIAARRFQVFDARITVPARRKVAIAVRCWAAARFRLNGLAA